MDPEEVSSTDRPERSPRIAPSPPALPAHEESDVDARIQASLARASHKKVVIATVLNPFPVAIAEVRLLLRSLRRFGGRHAHASTRVHTVGALDRELQAELQALGTEVRVCEQFHERCFTANKLGMLEDIGDADYLLMLDNDVVIGGDITPHLVGESLALKPECVDHLGIERWRALFGGLSLDAPSQRILTTIDSHETIAYYNSGVILVPRALVAPFRHAWGAAIRDVLDLCAEVPILAEVEPMTDQIALSVCLARHSLPRRSLPIAMNFHTRFAFHPVWEADTSRPILLHHHHSLTAGCAGLLPSSHPVPNQVIAAVNDALGSEQRPAGLSLPTKSFLARLRGRVK